MITQNTKDLGVIANGIAALAGDVDYFSSLVYLVGGDNHDGSITPPICVADRQEIRKDLGVLRAKLNHYEAVLIECFKEMDNEQTKAQPE